MTTKTDFTPREWEVLQKTLHEPGVAVMLASPGGVLAEVWAVMTGLLEAADEFAGSELVLALLAGGSRESDPAQTEEDLQETEKRPKRGHMNAMIHHLRQAARIVQKKATPQEVEDYRRLVLSLAERIARADREGGGDEAITPDEQRVLDEISLALNRKA